MTPLPRYLFSVPSEADYVDFRRFLPCQLPQVTRLPAGELLTVTVRNTDSWWLHPVFEMSGKENAA